MMMSSKRTVPMVTRLTRGSIPLGSFVALAMTLLAFGVSRLLLIPIRPALAAALVYGIVVFAGTLASGVYSQPKRMGTPQHRKRLVSG